jgi:hypothetical protein
LKAGTNIALDLTVKRRCEEALNCTYYIFASYLPKNHESIVRRLSKINQNSNGLPVIGTGIKNNRDFTRSFLQKN